MFIRSIWHTLTNSPERPLPPPVRSEERRRARRIESEEAETAHDLASVELIARLQKERLADLFPEIHTLKLLASPLPSKTSLDGIFQKVYESLNEVNYGITRFSSLLASLEGKIEKCPDAQLDTCFQECQKIKEDVYQLYREINQYNTLINTDFAYKHVEERFLNRHFEPLGAFILDLERVAILTQEYGPLLKALQAMPEQLKAFEASYDHAFEYYHAKKAKLFEIQTQKILTRGRRRGEVVGQTQALTIEIVSLDRPLYTITKTYLELLHQLTTSLDIENTHTEEALELIAHITTKLKEGVFNRKIYASHISQLIDQIRQPGDINDILRQQGEFFK